MEYATESTTQNKNSFDSHLTALIILLTIFKIITIAGTIAIQTVFWRFIISLF